MHGKHSAPTNGPAAQTGAGQDGRLAYSAAEAARRLHVSPLARYPAIAPRRLPRTPAAPLLPPALAPTPGAGALVGATGQAAGLVFGHTWLELAPADAALL